MMTNLEQHLISRGMDPTKYHVSYDDAEGVVTFYLYNLSGQIVGYQQYRPDQPSKKKKNDPKSGRYFTYLPREVEGVFGLDVLDYDDRTIYIVEGVFKAAVLHKLGYNSIAVLSATPKRMKPWFKILKQSWNLVAIGDNDPAGASLVTTVGKGFQSPVDLDEMLLESINNMITNFTEKTR